MSQRVPPALEIRGLAKSFGGQPVLAGVDLTVDRGQVHALLGENGAGKSTLIKILAGVHRADGGEIVVAGEPLPSRHRAEQVTAAGVQFVHQDLGLVDDLDVAENVALRIGYSRRAGLISFGSTRRRVGEVLGRLGVALDPRTPVGELEQAEKVMVAVARAFAADAGLIVLDEVTASLPAPEVNRLTALLKGACAEGVAFVFVTHRLDEALNLSDRISVLRDGTKVAESDAARVSHEQLIEWIVGRRVERLRPLSADPQVDSSRPAALSVAGLTGRGLSTPVSFDVAPGEVVAFTGLVGSGPRNVARCLAGAQAPTGGSAILTGRPLPLGDPVALARRGCRYVPGDRQAEGAVLDLSVRENLFLTGSTGRSRIVRPRREAAAATKLIERFSIRPWDSSELALAALSGGNQQKAVFGRALRQPPELLVLDDPTVGVDVGARVGLHQIVREAAASGVPVVLASSDFSEVASEATRAFVMRGGKVAVQLRTGELSEDRLVAESYRGEAG